jgi:hypothetical protein
MLKLLRKIGMLVQAVQIVPALLENAYYIPIGKLRYTLNYSFE